MLLPLPPSSFACVDSDFTLYEFHAGPLIRDNAEIVPVCNPRNRTILRNVTTNATNRYLESPGQFLVVPDVYKDIRSTFNLHPSITTTIAF